MPLDLSVASAARRLLAVIAVGLAALALPRLADAHAIIVDSLPKLNASVGQAGFPVELRFNSRIDHKRSKLAILDQAGKETDLPHKLDAAPDRMSANAPALPAGSYKLRWQVLAVDGHVTRGDIPFKVSR